MITRLADFGTCVTEWGMVDEWASAIRKGKAPA